MRKILIWVILLATATTSYCQQTKSGEPLTRQEYLTKSKNQRTAARILLIGGGALLATTIIIAAPGNISFDNLGTVVTIGAIGGVAALGSIPLFIASGRNKRKAVNASAYINLEKGSFIQQQNIKFSTYPAISIKINL